MNNTSATEYYDFWLYEFHKSLITMLELILIPSTVFGNVLLLCSLCQYKSLRTRSYALIGNLAVSDLMIGGIVLPYEVAIRIFPKLAKIKNVCLLHHAAFIGILGASVTNLFVISLERYHALKSPLKHYTNATKSNLVMTVTIGWIVPLTIGFLPLMGWNIWKPGVRCQGKFIHYEGYTDLVLTVYNTVIILSVILYIIVVRKILKQLKHYKSGHACQRGNVVVNNTRVYKNMKRTKIMICILGVFGFCWGPFATITIMKAYFIKESPLISVLEMYFLAFGLLNCGLNWIIFGLVNSTMRKAFRNVLCCFCRGNESVISVSSVTNTVDSTC